jgi:histidinol-phosphate aminotransferase
LGEYSERSDKSIRVALSKFYNNKLTPDQFITDNSAVSLLDLIERAFLDESSEVIICNPSFKPYALFAKKLGAKVIDVPLMGNDYDLNVDEVLKSINNNTRLIFLTSPNNPTGTHIPKVQMDKLVEHLPQHVVLVYDEVYYQFVDVDDNARAFDYLDSGINIIGVNSFSKAYGLAGLRIGYAYSSEKIAKYVSQARTPFMINTLAAEAAKAALLDEEFLSKTVNLIKKEKPFLYENLDKIGIHYWKSQANFITIKPAMDETEFEHKMLLEGVMVRPVSNFGAPGCIRVTIGDREANEAYLAALRKVLKK